MNHTPAEQTPKVSIVIPILNERENISPLIQTIKANLENKVELSELIFVDDNSEDGSAVQIELARKDDQRIVGIYRKGPKSLGKSVIEGLSIISGDYAVVMDGDLQHNPSYIADLLDACKGGTQIVIASRYAEHGRGFEDKLTRNLISRSLTILVQAALNIKVRDPLSGYFVIRKRHVKRIITSLDGLGYKILLEILNLTNNKDVVEIPMVFEERRFGQSKADLRTFHQFICQLITLRLHFISSEFVSFALVGTSGLIVHLLSLQALMGLGMAFQIAHLISALGAITNNYFLNKYLTFSDTRQTTTFSLMSWGLYLLATGVSLIANTGVAVFLNSQTGLVTFSSLCGLVLGVSWNFLTGRFILRPR